MFPNRTLHKKCLSLLTGFVTAMTVSAPLITPVKAQASDFEVLIIARKPNNSSVPLKNDAGHAWIALIKRDGNRWRTHRTYAFWPGSNLTMNHESDFNQTNQYLRGNFSPRRGFAVRKSKISVNRANWIKELGYRESGCVNYQAVGGTGTSCNCADFATRLWHVLSGKQDDFRIRAVTINLTLDSLVNSINRKNRQTGDFLDGGRVWE